MSDESAAHFEGQDQSQPQDPQKGRSISINITLHPDGQIQFQWPQGATKIVVYGLLETARAQFDKMVLMNETMAAKQKQAANAGLAGLRKRMNGG